MTKQELIEKWEEIIECQNIRIKREMESSQEILDNHYFMRLACQAVELTEAESIRGIVTEILNDIKKLEEL